MECKHCSLSAICIVRYTYFDTINGVILWNYAIYSAVWTNACHIYTHQTCVIFCMVKTNEWKNYALLLFGFWYFWLVFMFQVPKHAFYTQIQRACRAYPTTKTDAITTQLFFCDPLFRKIDVIIVQMNWYCKQFSALLLKFIENIIFI